MAAGGSGQHPPSREATLSTYTTCKDPDRHQQFWLSQPVKRGKRIIGKQVICTRCPAVWLVPTGEGW
jgi:hypothetical protein